LAISDRFLAVKAFALAGPPLSPPFLPNAEAAAFNSSFSFSVSSVSPVAISTIDLAFWFMSVGLFCLFAQAF
jgi:hypothetical protein